MSAEEQYMRLPRYVGEVVADLEARSNAPFTVEMDPTPAVEPNIAYTHATKDRSEHLLRLTPQFLRHSHHLILKTSLETLRVYLADPRDRKKRMPLRNARIPKLITESLKQMAEDRSEGGDPRVPVPGGSFDPRSPSVAQSIYSDVLWPLANVPTALRLEREIRDRFSEHRAKQEAYLKLYIENAVLTANQSSELIPIPMLAKSISAMHIAGAIGSAAVSERTFDRPSVSTDVRALADELYELVTSEPTKGHIGDRHIVDCWAERLDVWDWYRWDALELP